MKAKKFDQWSKTRQKGKKHFVLVYGVLAWGIPMYVVLALFVHRPESGFTVGYLVSSALVWFLGGLLFGTLTWSMNENRFYVEVNKRENT